MFTFVQAMEGVDFKGALTQLADKAGVELVAEDPKQRSERDRWYAALSAATAFYQSELTRTTAATVYLTDRGLSAETITAWQIGYAPGPPVAGWREVKQALTGQGYQPAELLQVGLVKTGDSGQDQFDVFRDRIMFPMCDPSGRVVAFSGRLLTPNDQAPKYVNSPETPLYKKSELLFGYDKAKQGIRTLDFSLVVEGQFDVVMAHQAGYTNTVAVSGTALTPHHVQLLERLSSRVVLALDADRAGIAAMKKAAEVMLARGLDVKIAPLPDGQDPADIIQSDPAEFKKIIGQSVPVIEFLLAVLCRNITDRRTLKLQARTEILPFVLLIENRIDQEHFVNVVADGIGSTAEAIRFELDRLRVDTQVATDHSQIVTKASMSADAGGSAGSIQAAYVYLLAVADVAEPTIAKVVQEALTTLPTDHLTIDPATQAKVTFTLEEQLPKQPLLALQEDIINRLQFLRTKLQQEKLASLRNELSAAEASAGDITLILTQIQSVQNKLKAEPFTVEIFSK